MPEEEYSWPLESFSDSSGFHKTTVVTRLRSGFASGELVQGYVFAFVHVCCTAIRILGGSGVVISGAVISPHNIGYNYSYPTYHPTYNYP